MSNVQILAELNFGGDGDARALTLDLSFQDSKHQLPTCRNARENREEQVLGQPLPVLALLQFHVKCTWDDIQVSLGLGCGPPTTSPLQCVRFLIGSACS